jgi:WD40 repeat protein
MALSANGKTLAWSQPDADVHIRDVASGKDIRLLKVEENPQAPFLTLALSADGKTVAVCAFLRVGKDLVQGAPQIALYDTVRGTPLRRLRDGVNPGDLAFSPDGKSLVCWSREKAPRRWEVATGRPLPLPAKGVVSSVAFLPDGTLACGDEDHTVRLWDLRAGKELRRFRARLASVRCLAVSADGKRLAVGTGTVTDAPGEVELWDLATGRRLHRLGPHPQAVLAVAFSPDGKTLASGCDEPEIRLWDVATGKRLLSRPGHSSAVARVAWSPDGKTLATAGDERAVYLWEAGSARVLRVLTGEGPPEAFDPDDPAAALAFSPDGKRLAVSTAGAVDVYGPATGKLLRRLKSAGDRFRAVAFLPDGRTLAAWGPGGVFVHWETATGKRLFRRKGDTREGKWSGALSPDGRLLAQAGVIEEGEGETEVTLHEVSTGLVLRRTNPEWRATCLALSPDGRTLISLAQNGTVRAEEVASGRPRRVFPNAACETFSPLAVCPRGRFVALCEGEGVLVLDLVTGRKAHRCQSPESQPCALAFSPDGRSLAVGYVDTTTLVWDVSDLAATGR